MHRRAAHGNEENAPRHGYSGHEFIARQYRDKLVEASSDNCMSLVSTRGSGNHCPDADPAARLVMGVKFLQGRMPPDLAWRAARVDGPPDAIVLAD